MATKRVKYISASQISQFLYCPVSYYHLYVMDESKGPENEYAIFGSAIHKALAVNFTQKIESRSDLDTKIVQETFIQAFRGELEAKKVRLDTLAFDSMSMTGLNMLDKYMAEIAPTIQPAHVELRFELKLKAYPITIMGFIDLITEDGWIVDHKTAGKTTKRDWNQASVNSNMQLTMYSAAYRKLFNKQEAGVRIDLLPREPKPEFQQIRSQRTQEQIHEVLDLASKIEEIVELGVFVPVLSNCSGCPLSKLCTKKPLIIK